MSEPTRVTQRGLYFEEFSEGVVYVHRPGRTMTEADNTFFSALTMNPQAIHVDAQFSATTEFGQRLMNSMHTLATMVGLSVGQLTQGTIVANLGFTDVSFPAPVFAGDTINCESTCVAKRLSKSRPGQGIVTLEHVARNQDGVVVGKATRNVMMQCRPADPS